MKIEDSSTPKQKRPYKRRNTQDKSATESSSKRKRTVDQNQLTLDECSQLSRSESTSHNGTTKKYTGKKRGPKPKNKSLEDNSVNDSQTPSNVDVQCSNNDLHSSENHQSHSESTSQNGPAKKSTGYTGKKRGSKPKNKSPQDDSVNSAEQCSYNDLFLDENNQDSDENNEEVKDNPGSSDEGSDYEPSDQELEIEEECELPVVDNSGVSTRTRRSMASNRKRTPDMTEKRDIYDFDAQSLLSERRGRPSKKKSKSSTKRKNVGSTSRAAHKSSKSTNWSSNIYSALSAALKTRQDLESYTNFLKSNFLNSSMDNLLSSICSPSIQHTDLFFGASSSLQNLLGRINDHDKVLNILHAFTSTDYEEKQHRVTSLIPLVHQPVFGTSFFSTFSNTFDSLAMSIDPEMTIRPGYILDEQINLLAMHIPDVNGCGVSNLQYNSITGTGSIGHFMPEMKQLIVTSDIHEKFSNLVSVPIERIYEVAESTAKGQCVLDEEDADLADDLNLQRIVIVLNGNNDPIAITLLDTWDRTLVPQNRSTNDIDLVSISKNENKSSETQVKEVVNNLMDKVIDPTSGDTVSDAAGADELACDPDNLDTFDDLRYVDAFLVKPNGRQDALLLILPQCCFHPPSQAFDEKFRIYLILDENKFILERHGFAPDMPIALDGVHLADPEDLLDEKSLLVVPDLLYDTLKKVMLRELVSTAGSLSLISDLVPLKKEQNSTSSQGVVQCAKFVILDRMTRVPISVVCDSPVRFTLQLPSDQVAFNSFGNSASKQFDSISSSELKNTETNFQPTTSQFRLVAVNGLLFGIQIDDLRVIHRIVEVVPARVNYVFPYRENLPYSAHSIIGSHESCSASVQIINEETSSSTVLPAFYYPRPERQKSVEVFYGFADLIYDKLIDLPIKLSLFDVSFRIAQKHTPELLAKQHVEASLAAAQAEAAVNPQASRPATVPLPDYWTVCTMCSKGLRSLTGLLNHELRHFGLTRFCGIRKSANDLQLIQRSIVHNLQEDSESEHEDDNEESVGGGDKKSNLKAGLTQVFNVELLADRMEAPKCDRCGDSFLSTDILVQHLEYCDGISFLIRTPLPKNDDSQPVDIITTTDDPNTTEEETAASKNPLICGLCGMKQMSKKKIIQHFNQQHLQCMVCDQALPSLPELSKHYREHSKGTNVSGLSATNESDVAAALNDYNNKISCIMTCDLCSNFWGTQDNFYFHQWTEHGLVHPPIGSSEDAQILRQDRTNKFKVPKNPTAAVRLINCKYCSEIVRITGDIYVNHLANNHNIITDQTSFCKICGDAYPNMAGLSVHLNDVHVPTGEYDYAGIQTIYRCPHCNFWAFQHGLLKHAKEEHGETAPAMYQCQHCFERFCDKQVWYTHISKHNEGYTHKCPECDRSFKLRATLLNHIRFNHGNEDVACTCEFCGNTFPKMSALKFHISQVHNQELPYECDICHRRFRVDYELRRHAKELHSGALRCEICHKICANLRCYAQHRQKHFRTRIYQCTDCDTTFKSKAAMKRHIRIEHLQLGPERYECQICGKIVTQIGMHMLTHKDAKFECEYCNKRFTKIAYYNEHLRIHRGEQPFECHICQKRFNKKSNLNVHVKFHEKHRDEEGNYLELKPRGRVSTMFGDALMSPSERHARQLALKTKNMPKIDVAVGSDVTGAFNVGGRANAASEACQRALLAGDDHQPVIDGDICMTGDGNHLADLDVVANSVLEAVAMPPAVTTLKLDDESMVITTDATF